mmetsp:Transcript_11548/g.48437  ORF Transcript_11548/g.48437 Transcript_11548/m.48437 type:complete len:231 (-) Transcript_11548:234-926(-)
MSSAFLRFSCAYRAASCPSRSLASITSVTPFKPSCSKPDAGSALRSSCKRRRNSWLSLSSLCRAAAASSKRYCRLCVRLRSRSNNTIASSSACCLSIMSVAIAESIQAPSPPTPSPPPPSKPAATSFSRARRSASRGHARAVSEILPTSSPRSAPPAAVPPPQIRGTWFSSVGRPPAPRSATGTTARQIIPAEFTSSRTIAAPIWIADCETNNAALCPVGHSGGPDRLEP